MRTFLNELQLIEHFLLNKCPAGDTLLMQARLTIDPALRKKVAIQRKVYDLVRGYGRKKLKEEVAAVYQKLFDDPEKHPFRQEIIRIFS